MQNERQLVEERLYEIRKYKEEAGMNREIVIAGGEAVLKENAEEFKALKRMQEILNDNLRQSSQFEYLEEREKTQLPKLTPEQSNNFIDSEQLKKKEKDEVESRMAAILSSSRMAGHGSTFETASDGKVVISTDKEEYEKLIKMKKIIGDNFYTENYYEYMNLRTETKLGPIDKTKYEILMGREFIEQNDYDNSNDKSDSIIDDKSIPIAEENNQLNELSPLQEQMLIETTPKDIQLDQTSQSQTPPAKQTESESAMEPLPDSPYPVPLENETPEETEDLIEIEEITPWQWVRDHKKQILIALGITALTISTIVILTQLLPAIVAASQASQVAGLAAEMTANSQLWFAASASEQIALHGANTALADIITSLSGVANSFDVGAGVWNIGAQTLPEFASSASLAADAAIGKVSALTNISTIASVGGLGALGAGLILPKKKSEAYHNIKKTISKFTLAAETLSEEVRKETAKSIKNKIDASTELSASEKNILLKKLQKILRKYKSRDRRIDEMSPDLELDANIDNDIIEGKIEIVDEVPERLLEQFSEVRIQGKSL